MALNSGHDSDNTTLPAGSMAEAMYDALNAEFGALSGDEDDNRKRACAAMSKGIVDHIKANADVIIGTGDGELQQYTDADGVTQDTSAPSAERTISGAVE